MSKENASKNYVFIGKSVYELYTDALTVSTRVNELFETYKVQGWRVEKIQRIGIKLHLDNGFILISWKDGVFYQELYISIAP